MKRKSKFLTFTIKGDTLDPEQIKALVDLPCEIYKKGEITTYLYGKHQWTQKTNRWLFAPFAQDTTSVNTFLVTNLRILAKYADVLSQYTQKYRSLIELVIYDEDKKAPFCIKLSKETLSLLSKLHAPFKVVFWDW